MSMTARRRAARYRVFAAPGAVLCALTMLAFGGTTLGAQTIRIKLVNGRNGQPVERACVNVWAGKSRKQAMAIPTNKQGIAVLQLASTDAKFDTSNRPNGCGLFGVVNPVAPYSSSIRINVGYVLCQARKPDHTWLAVQTFSTQEIFRSGIVTGNTCGKASAPRTPGEVVIFVRPLSWWEKLKG